MVNTQNGSETELIRLIFRYLYSKINIQHILYFLVFITFDLGDAVTGAIMMDTKGIGAEFNFIIRCIYANHGLAGLITAKFGLIIIPLIMASIIYEESYWMINGILVALIIAGVMAIQANLQALADFPHMNPTDIIILYVLALFVLMAIGNIMDTHRKQRRKAHTMT